MATFLYHEKDFLIRELGLPDRKVNENGKDMWIYEELKTRVSPRRKTETIKKYNKQGFPTEKEVIIIPESISKKLYYKGFIFDEHGMIIDTFYGQKEIDTSLRTNY
ncbi:MAG: hypothetical protein NE330_23825 [Lentisphaeraceae bacterium]|nr:hypothetical protein [Lentisphaeraceae bacterium]